MGTQATWRWPTATRILTGTICCCCGVLCTCCWNCICVTLGAGRARGCFVKDDCW